VGGGLAYGNLGYSHHGVQDYAVMRSLPNMTVLAPADPGETRECLQWLVAHPGPSYLRLGKAGEPQLHDVRGVDRGPLLVKAGEGDTAIVACGSVLKVALAAAEALEKIGRRVPVYSLPWLKPMTQDFLAPLSHYTHILAVEEHVSSGGLADLLRSNVRSTVESAALPERVASHVGSQEFLRDVAELSVAAITSRLDRGSTLV
jgi:transketolase